MKPHYHHDFVGVFVTAIEVALIFHAIRFLAGRATTSDNPTVATIGAAVGGAFTFSGQH